MVYGEALDRLDAILSTHLAQGLVTTRRSVRVCYRAGRNQGRIGPKVTGTTDIWNTLLLQVGASYCGKGSPDLSLNQCHDDLRVVINLHAPNIPCLIEGWYAK